MPGLHPLRAPSPGAKKELISELQTLSSDTAMFEQFSKQDADIIERDARDRIIDHYDQITKAMLEPEIDSDKDVEAGGVKKEKGPLTTPGP